MKLKNKKINFEKKIILEFCDGYSNRYGKEYSVLVSISQFVKGLYQQTEPVILGQGGLTHIEMDNLYENLSIKIYEQLTQDERDRMLND